MVANHNVKVWVYLEWYVIGARVCDVSSLVILITIASWSGLFLSDCFIAGNVYPDKLWPVDFTSNYKFNVCVLYFK